MREKNIKEKLNKPFIKLKLTYVSKSKYYYFHILK